MIAENDVNHAIVFDIGSGTTQVGFAGEVLPMYSIPSVAAKSSDIQFDEATQKYSFEDNSLFSTSPSPELINFFDSDYNFADSNAIVDLFQASHERLNVSEPSEHSALFSSPAYLSRNDQIIEWYKVLSEIAFNVFNYRSISISPDAILSSYAHCFQTATVVDFGWSSTRIVPIIEGKIPNQESTQVHLIGGFALTQLFLQQLQARHITLTSPSSLTPEQKRLYDRKSILEILKQNCTFSSEPSESDYCAFINGNRQIDLHSEISLISSLHWISSNPLSSEDSEKNDQSEIVLTPIPELVEKAISSSTQKTTLWHNIVTSGGFSTLDSYIDRLQTEISNFVKDGSIKPRVHFPMHKLNGGEYTVWTGGSILASSDIFPHFCVTKQEWEENGEDILRIKFH